MNGINIIQGDTYEAELEVEGLDDISLIEKCVFSCCFLKFSKELTKSIDNKFLLEFTPEETAAMKVGFSDYDITLYFFNGAVATTIYKGNIQILPKQNKC